MLIEGSQQDFPVLDGDRVVGVLTHARLFEALHEHGEWTLVAEVMDRDFRTVAPDQSLDAALFTSEPGCTVIPVLQRGEIVGLLTAENVGELLMIQSARVRRATPPPISRSGYARRF